MDVISWQNTVVQMPTAQIAIQSGNVYLVKGSRNRSGL